MVDQPRNTWESLLLEKKKVLGTDFVTIQDEPTFRTAFEQLCDDNDQNDPQRLLGTLLLPSGHIIAFTGGIDSSCDLRAPDNLTTLLWSFEYAVLQTAILADVKLLKFIRTLKQLKTAVPHFGANLSRYPEDSGVQTPLQKLFVEYISCYEMILSYFASNPVPLSFDHLPLRFETATAIIRDAKQEWDVAMEKATDNEKRILLLSSVPSLPSGLDGASLQPQSTNVHFQFLEHLGEGTHGRVSKVKEAATGQIYARKNFQVSRESRSRVVIETQVKEEVSIMQKLRHQHIASCLFWTRDVDAYSILMLPVADYDLKVFLELECVDKDYPKARLRQMDQWFGCLVSALGFAHDQSVEHHDIKPSNVLIKDGQPYLADFGSAKDFSMYESSKGADDMFAGTPIYYAPERRPWGRAADVFALGCVFSEMLTVRHNKTLNDYREFRRSPDSDHHWAFRDNIPRVEEWLAELTAATEALELVIEQTIKMLLKDPNRRPGPKLIKKRFRQEEDILFCHTCS